MNDHCKVLYQNRVFGADRNSKMAATAEHSLALDPMGMHLKIFFLEMTEIFEALHIY